MQHHTVCISVTSKSRSIGLGRFDGYKKKMVKISNKLSNIKFNYIDFLITLFLTVIFVWSISNDIFQNIQDLTKPYKYFFMASPDLLIYMYSKYWNSEIN